MGHRLADAEQADVSVLNTPEEQELIKQLAALPESLNPEGVHLSDQAINPDGIVHISLHLLYPGSQQQHFFLGTRIFQQPLSVVA